MRNVSPIRFTAQSKITRLTQFNGFGIDMTFLSNDLSHVTVTAVLPALLTSMEPQLLL